VYIELQGGAVTPAMRYRCSRQSSVRDSAARSSSCPCREYANYDCQYDRQLYLPRTCRR